MKKLLLFAGIAMLVPAAALAQFGVNQWVLARSASGGPYWFPGVIQSIDGSRIVVAFDDGTREVRTADQIRPYSWEVGSRITCRWAQDGLWYDAAITAMSRDGTQLTIRFDDGVVQRTPTGHCRQ